LAKKQISSQGLTSLTHLGQQKMSQVMFLEGLSLPNNYKGSQLCLYSLR